MAVGLGCEQLKIKFKLKHDLLSYDVKGYVQEDLIILRMFDVALRTAEYMTSLMIVLTRGNAAGFTS